MQNGAYELTLDDISEVISIASQINPRFANKAVKHPPIRMTQGVLNQVYQLRLDLENFAVKWLNGKNLDPTACGSHQELYELHQHLYDNGVSVPQPFAYIKDIQGSPAILMKFIHGAPAEANSLNMLMLGRLIACFHDVTQDFPAFEKKPSDARAVLFEISQSFKRMWCQGNIRQELAYLWTFGKYAIGTVFYPSDDQLPGGFIHGDIHRDNVLKGNDDGLFLLDFDLVQEGKYIKDIANAICMFCLPETAEGQYQFDEQLALQIIKGYERVRELSDDEQQYLGVAILDRIGLEKVGNMKLRNEGKPPGTNFNAQRAIVMQQFLDKHWPEFMLKASKKPRDQQGELRIATDSHSQALRFSPHMQPANQSQSHAAGPSNEELRQRKKF